MKKKLIPLILMLVCAIACALGLAACGNGDNEPLFDKTVIVRYSNGEELGSSADFGEFVYMDIDNAPVLDFKVCARYADGTLVDLKLEDLTAKYRYNEEEITDFPSSYSEYKVGSYSAEFTYKGSMARVYFYVGKSDKAHYAATPSKLNWKYGEEGATLSVNGSTDFTTYYVTEAAYNEIKNAADKTTQLESNMQSYVAERPWDMKPGIYYLVAKCAATENYKETYSDLKKVTVLKGDLTIKNAESISADHYQYGRNDTKVGNLKLSDLYISTSVEDGERAYAVNGFGNEISGKFVWQNPDTEVNVTKSGREYWVKFVADDEYYEGIYNEKMTVAQVEITIKKGFVIKPTAEPSWRETVYNGKDQAVSAGYYTWDYDKYVTATRNGTTTEIYMEDSGTDSIIDSVREVGTYNYVLSLKDKVNFAWLDYDDIPLEGTGNLDTSLLSDVADINFQFKVLPMESDVAFYNYDNAQLVPNKDGVIKIRVDQFATPYVAGTLQAEALTEIYDGDIKSDCTGTATIITEDGKDYLVISNIQQKSEYYLGTLFIRFTATGKDNYADIDCISQQFYLEIEPDCPIRDENTITVYDGIKGKKLYESYPHLKTTAGDWKFYIKVGGSYHLVGDDDVIPGVGEYECKLEFDETNIDAERVPEPVSFTINCVELTACPIENGQRIEVPVGTTVSALYEAYPDLTTEHGKWCLSMYIDEYKSWITLGDDDTVPAAGEYMCRLDLSPNDLSVVPESVEFILVGTN